MCCSGSGENNFVMLSTYELVFSKKLNITKQKLPFLLGFNNPRLVSGTQRSVEVHASVEAPNKGQAERRPGSNRQRRARSSQQLLSCSLRPRGKTSNESKHPHQPRFVFCESVTIRCKNKILSITRRNRSCSKNV